MSFPTTRSCHRYPPLQHDYVSLITIAFPDIIPHILMRMRYICRICMPSHVHAYSCVWSCCQVRKCNLRLGKGLGNLLQSAAKGVLQFVFPTERQIKKLAPQPRMWCSGLEPSLLLVRGSPLHCTCDHNHHGTPNFLLNLMCRGPSPGLGSAGVAALAGFWTRQG